MPLDDERNIHPPLTDVEAASFLGVAVQTMRNWRHQGQGPAYHKLTPGPRGRVRYLLEDLITFRNRGRVDPERHERGIQLGNQTRGRFPGGHQRKPT